MDFAQIFYYSTYILISTFIFFIFKKINFKLAKYLNLYDFPNENKIHKQKTPLAGGFTIFYVFLLSHLIFLKTSSIENDILFILLSSSAYFLIGLIDDKKNLSYLIKFFLFIIITFFTIYFSNNLILDKLYFETFNTYIYLDGIAKYLITLLCILLLINATNLSDGINGLCIGIVIIWLSYLSFKFNIYLFSIPIITVMFLTFYYNVKGHFFLGNSGSHFLSCFIGLIIIYSYNLSHSQDNNFKISVEEIFILLMLPGIDMLRLFIFRILNKRNPFSSDLLHFHHYLLNKYKLFNCLAIYFSLMIFPILIYNLSEVKSYIIIISVFIIYFGFLRILSKKKF